MTSIPFASTKRLPCPCRTISRSITAKSQESVTRKKSSCTKISHNETGTFYGYQCPLETRQRLEFRADKWAFQHLVPIEELTIAVHQGYTETWELAEYFDVSEIVVRKAIAYYRENGMI